MLLPEKVIPELGFKMIVPLLATNAPVPEMVTFPLKVLVPLLALKMPGEVTVKAPDIVGVVVLVKSKVPPLTVTALAVKELLTVIAPELRVNAAAGLKVILLSVVNVLPLTVTAPVEVIPAVNISVRAGNETLLVKAKVMLFCCSLRVKVVIFG